MNRQEVFDKVAKHLLTQGAHSMSRDRAIACAYRGAEGRKCAIGVLIDDAAYSPALESKTATMPDVIAALNASGVHVEYASGDAWFIDRLQTIHDLYDPPFWRERLESFAGDEGLSAAVLS